METKKLKVKEQFMENQFSEFMLKFTGIGQSKIFDNCCIVEFYGSIIGTDGIEKKDGNEAICLCNLSNGWENSFLCTQE